MMIIYQHLKLIIKRIIIQNSPKNKTNISMFKLIPNKYQVKDKKINLNQILIQIQSIKRVLKMYFKMNLMSK